jgi:hypothetical protein
LELIDVAIALWDAGDDRDILRFPDAWGEAPFGGESVIQTIAAVMTHLPEPPTKRNAKVPRDLELICLKCLEKNPLDRYPTAQALVDDLRRFDAGEPVSVRAAGAVERVAKWARRADAGRRVYPQVAIAAVRRAGGRSRLAVARRGTIAGCCGSCTRQ